MVISFFIFFAGVKAEDLHSLLQARSATHLQNANFVAQFSEKVQTASGVLSVSREESMICAMVTKGAQAPAVGMFIRGDGAPLAVRAPFVAPTNGKYCVENHVFSMLQRAYGIHSAQDVEDAIGQKDQSNQNDNETEQAMGGKNGGEDAESSTGSKSAQTTTTTTTTDGPGAHCRDTNRRCCSVWKPCDPGYEPVWDPICEYANPWRFDAKVGCKFQHCYKCLKTGDPILQTPICLKNKNGTHLTKEWAECFPTFYNMNWTRGVNYEGNPYYEENLYKWAACRNDTDAWKGGELTWKDPFGGILCLGSNYRERGCTYNHHVAMNRTTEDLGPNKTIADYDWTGTMCRFLPE